MFKFLYDNNFYVFRLKKCERLNAIQHNAVYCVDEPLNLKMIDEKF